MRIGLMADTHDKLDAVERVVNLFNGIGIEHVLHAGDLVSPFVVDRLVRLKAKLHYVWGNNEGDREMVIARFEEFGIKPLGDFTSVELDGRRIALLHGTHEGIVEALLKSGSFDVVVRGHTHRTEVRKGQTLMVNPGETCGYLTGRGTVALLDTIDLSVEILEL
jgi:hypothetical protein